MSDNSSVLTSPNMLNALAKYPTPPYTSIAAPSPLSSTTSVEIFKYTMFTSTASTNVIRYLNNILLILFRNHPTGIFESELVSLYHQMFGEFISINQDLQYLLQNHQAIRCTPHPILGVLYTLDPTQISSILQSFGPLIIKPYVAEHVLKLFSYYPNGIACICFEDALQKISQFKLSHVIPLWIPFITSIPFVIYCNVGGVPTFLNTCALRPPPVHVNAFTPFLKSNTTQCSICTETPHIRTREALISTDHQRSPFMEDHCSVFMGGFQHGTTTQDIHRALNLLGTVVISCTEIKYRKFGFSWVTLSSTKEADYLIQMSPIKMLNATIDIRPFINRDRQQNSKPEDEVILKAMVELLLNSKQQNMSLSIRQMQPILYRSLSYRVSGTDLVEIIKKNSEVLCIKSDENGQEKILFTC